MSILLEHRDDGSLACFLDGDLQFDSRDERIYHEALALPALAIAESRHHLPLKALIIGGGDGLTARELLKSARVSEIDLVDYDAKILEMARTEFARFNGGSLTDKRVHVTIEDARDFVKNALDAGIKYDIIISDLTAAHDADAAQLQTVEFYERLRRLLGDRGVLAVNSASPSGTPEAFWSIYNSMLTGALHPRAYSISLPSFAAQGYGADWGFILASPQPIDAADFADNLSLAEPRTELKDSEQVRNLFLMHEDVFARQASTCAANSNSDILVHYLFNPQPIVTESSTFIDMLSIDLAQLTAPQHSGSQLLPQEVCKSLSQWHDEPLQQQQLMSEVFELMPALRRFQTREMIDDFLARPSAFLAPIDLGGLVNALLSRVSELPEKLAQELDFLKDKIEEFAGDNDRLLSLGLRSLAIIAVVVIIGNLMYPDAVYAKGHAGHDAAHAAHRGVGRGGGYGYTNNVYNTTGHWGPWYTNASGKRVRNWIR
jgi:spermidine synthase